MKGKVKAPSIDFKGNSFAKELEEALNVSPVPYCKLSPS